MNPGDSRPVTVPQSASFDDFFREEFSSMVSLAAAVSGRRDVAEDIAQESFTKAHRHWDRIQDFERPGAWIRRVTINGALSRKRRGATEAKTRLALVGEQTRGVGSRAASGPDHEVWQAVVLLPGKQRAAIALFYLEERTVAEIAEILECSPSTAKVHLHRGRTKLAELLAPGSGAGSDHSPNPSSSPSSSKKPNTENNGGRS